MSIRGLNELGRLPVHNKDTVCTIEIHNAIYDSQVWITSLLDTLLSFNYTVSIVDSILVHNWEQHELLFLSPPFPNRYWNKYWKLSSILSQSLKLCITSFTAFHCENMLLWLSLNVTRSVGTNKYKYLARVLTTWPLSTLTAVVLYIIAPPSHCLLILITVPSLNSLLWIKLQVQPEFDGSPLLQ